MADYLQRKTNLPEHVVQFIRYLRTKGFNVGPSETGELLEVFSRSVPASFAEHQGIYKAILVKNRKQFFQFDQLFTDYWHQLERAEDSKLKEEAEEAPKPRSGGQATPLQTLKSWLFNGRQDDEVEMAQYSALEAISKKDFSAFDSEEYKDLLQIIKLIARKLANRKSRRFISSRSTKQLDLKKTIYRSMRKGMEIDQLFFKERQIKKTNLILICDVSRSMELYSKFLIEFMYGFQQAGLRIRTFVFSTRLIAIPPSMMDHGFHEMLENLSEQVPYWSGGTRIGASLQQFQDGYASKLLNAQSMVIILSDGWDTGAAEQLGEVMRSIHRKAERVIWLNPLAGRPGFKVETAAMKAALPYIDIFTSAHNLETLTAVSKQVGQKQFSLL